MILDPNSLLTNVLVTVMTLVMVFALPYIDRKVCAKLGVSLNDGVSTNPKADHYLHLRKILLIVMFAVYLLLVGYVAFFSRDAAEDYRVHADLYHDLADSIQIDFGLLGLIAAIFRDGFREAMSHVTIQHTENIAQVYMNICMFIPMGYLLPYIFDWFRRRPLRRTVFVCFLASLAVENIQLVTKLGFYDIDDLFSNTIGGYFGVLLYLSVAYVLAHPDWRERMENQRLYRKEAKKTALYPFFRKVHIVRSTLFAIDNTAVLDFYVTKMGMYLARTIENGKETDYLLTFGKNQIEIRCLPGNVSLPSQNITLACNNSEYLKKRLTEHGISVSEYSADPYSGLRTFSFEAPDHTRITIIEE